MTPKYPTQAILSYNNIKSPCPPNSVWLVVSLQLIHAIWILKCIVHHPFRVKARHIQLTHFILGMSLEAPIIPERHIVRC